MKRPWTRIPLLIAIAALHGITAVADTVKLLDRPAFERVEVLAFKQGIVHFRGLSQQTLRKPLPQIERLSIAGLDRFNEAEIAAAAMRWDDALAAYDAAISATADGWQKDLVAARRLATLDASGAFDRAVEEFVVAVSDSGTGAAPSPRHPGPTASAVNQAARKSLEQAVRAARTTETRRVLRTLLLEVLLVEDETPPARLFPKPARTAPPAAEPRPAAPRRIRLDLPAPRQAAPKQAAITLPDKTMVRPHVERLLASGAANQAVRTAERALTYAAPEAQPAWELILGRARIDAGDAANAAAGLLKLSESGIDATLAAEALFYVGYAHEKLNREDVATSLYRELLLRPDLPADLLERVLAALARIE